MEFAIAKISTKGQIVIPSHMREGIEKGDTVLIVRDKGNLVMKNMKVVAKELRDDLKSASRIERAYKEIEEGRFKQMSDQEFLKEIKKWKQDLLKSSKKSSGK